MEARTEGRSPAGAEVKRTLLVAAGVVSTGLGVVGLFLPLVPTTPFLLLAAYLFARSSPAHYDRLLGHRVLGPFVRDWVERKGLRRSVKARAVILLWVVILPTSLALGHRGASGIVLLAIGAGVSAFLLSRPTLPEEPGRERP